MKRSFGKKALFVVLLSICDNKQLFLLSIWIYSREAEWFRTHQCAEYHKKAAENRRRNWSGEEENTTRGRRRRLRKVGDYFIKRFIFCVYDMRGLSKFSIFLNIIFYSRLDRSPGFWQKSLCSDEMVLWSNVEFGRTVWRVTWACLKSRSRLTALPLIRRLSQWGLGGWGKSGNVPFKPNTLVV